MPYDSLCIHDKQEFDARLLLARTTIEHDANSPGAVLNHTMVQDLLQQAYDSILSDIEKSRKVSNSVEFARIFQHFVSTYRENSLMKDSFSRNQMIPTLRAFASAQRNQYHDVYGQWREHEICVQYLNGDLTPFEQVTILDQITWIASANTMPNMEMNTWPTYLLRQELVNRAIVLSKKLTLSPAESRERRRLMNEGPVDNASSRRRDNFVAKSLEDMKIAVAMAFHPRLGVDSSLSSLDHSLFMSHVPISQPLLPERDTEQFQRASFEYLRSLPPVLNEYQ